MLLREFFDHINPEGEDPGNRLDRANAGSKHAWGENIWEYRSGTVNGAYQSVTDWAALVAQAEDNWMHSPPHRKNILSDAYTHLGAGISYDPAKGRATMVQVFFTPMP
jgi:uncharacterized protein YkwD